MAGAVLLAVGCASHPAPTDQVATSIAAVRGAEEAGAGDVPEAALHMKLAQEQIDRAKKLMEDDDNLEAEELAVRANQDAELALALARENQSKQRLEQFASTSQTAGGESGAMPPANANPNPTAKP